MRLTDFIAQHHEAIIADWVEFASTLRPWADGRSTKSLRDHAEELLTAVVSDMEAPQTDTEKSDKSQGLAMRGALARVGQKHAAQRLASGFDLEQLVSEYRALRASIMRLWSARQDGGADDDVTRFHEAIDESLTEAAVRYSEMLDLTREQFVGILGHDLRNPLHAIVIGATMLTKNESLDDQDARVATRILNAGNRMTRMVSNLLDLARTRLGTGIPVVTKQMDLAPICRQLISELEIIHPHARVRFEAHGVLLGEWDPDRLHQAISNLVSNALQHGRPDGDVTVVAREHGEDVVLRVHNEGPPISEAAIVKIFEPMAGTASDRADRPRTGLGLGLFIAREVALAHGGSLTATSTEKDGTTFTLLLPRRPPSTLQQTATVPTENDEIGLTPPTPGRKGPPLRRAGANGTRTS